MFNRKPCTLLIGFCFIVKAVFGQDQKLADSLAKIYQQNNLNDTAKYELLVDLSFNELKDLNKGLKYAEELINLSEKNHNYKYLRAGYFLKGTKKRMLGELEDALGAYFKSAEIAGKLHQVNAEGEAYGAIADVYSIANNHSNAMLYYNKAIDALRQTKDSISLASVISNAGDEFVKNKNFDSALLYFQEAKIIFDKINYVSGKAYSIGNIGMVYANTGKNDIAEKNINEAVSLLEELQDYYPVCDYLISIAKIYWNKANSRKAVSYALESLNLAERYGLKEQIADASLKLSGFYEKAGDTSAAFSYYKKYITYRDSINDLKTVQRLADLRTNYEVSQKQLEVDRLNEQKRNEKKLTLSLIIILCLTVSILFILLKNNQNKQKAYKILNEQKHQIEAQKIKAESTLSELKLTQKQLIQTAKMASLGELTAGIAHEIQNPLNFVNNFSEVNIELLEELRQELVTKLQASDKAQMNEIINGIEDNLVKINKHGKRADAIVKGMLQHSVASTGKKELTDINTLAEEYFRLSYHGIKAKDKEFDVDFSIELDKSIRKIEIVPQDIGRVLLNLYNNAFYSVKEKKKLTNDSYEPHISVCSKNGGNWVELSVKDNGVGISSKLVDKIFQPFFTTKPTGQGTGLGLSLSYDIIKAHGGELKVKTKQGEFAEFIIQLPVNNAAK